MKYLNKIKSYFITSLAWLKYKIWLNFTFEGRKEYREKVLQEIRMKTYVDTLSNIGEDPNLNSFGIRFIGTIPPDWKYRIDAKIKEKEKEEK